MPRDDSCTHFQNKAPADDPRGVDRALHHPDHTLLVERLHQLRVDAGLTQRELAARLGCAHNLVARIEQGGRRVDALELVWFCRALGCDPVEFFAEFVGALPTHRRTRRR